MPVGPSSRRLRRSTKTVRDRLPRGRAHLPDLVCLTQCLHPLHEIATSVRRGKVLLHVLDPGPTVRISRGEHKRLVEAHAQSAVCCGRCSRRLACCRARFWWRRRAGLLRRIHGNESRATRLEGTWCCRAPHADHHQPGFSDAKREVGEVTVTRDNAKAFEWASMEQVHGIDHEGNIGCVPAPTRAGAYGSALYGPDGAFSQYAPPRVEARASPIAVGATNDGGAVRLDRSDQVRDRAVARIFRVDQDGKAPRAIRKVGLLRRGVGRLVILANQRCALSGRAHVTHASFAPPSPRSSRT